MSLAKNFDKWIFQEKDIPFDAHGSNGAINCPAPDCSHPLLFTAAPPNWGRGVEEKKFVTCKGCKKKYWLDLTREHEKTAVVHEK